MKKSKALIIAVVLSTSLTAQYGDWPLESIDSLWKQHEIIIENYDQTMFPDLVWVKYKIACYQDSVSINLGIGINLYQEPNYNYKSEVLVRRVPDAYGYRQYRLKILMELLEYDKLDWFTMFKKKIWKP